MQTVKVEMGTGFLLVVEREGSRRRGTFETWGSAARSIGDWLDGARGPVAVYIDRELIALTAADEVVPFLNALVSRRTSAVAA